MKDFEAYSVGLVNASVCSSLKPEEVEDRLNAEHPTGISSRWKISKDKTFGDGTTEHPCPCENNPKTHKHYLLNC